MSSMSAMVGRTDSLQTRIPAGSPEKPGQGKMRLVVQEVFRPGRLVICGSDQSVDGGGTAELRVVNVYVDKLKQPLNTDFAQRESVGIPVSWFADLASEQKFSAMVKGSVFEVLLLNTTGQDVEVKAELTGRSFK